MDQRHGRGLQGGGHGRGSGLPCWGGPGAARKASWRRRESAHRHLKNQQSPQVKKGGTELQAAMTGEAQGREGPVYSEPGHGLCACVRACVAVSGPGSPVQNWEWSGPWPPTGFSSVACVWTTSSLPAASSERGSLQTQLRERFPSNHQSQRPPPTPHPLDVTSWESQSHSLLGPLETRPGPKASRCPSDRCADVEESKDAGASLRRLPPVHKSEAPAQRGRATCQRPHSV